jgi:predicted methyltransferase
MRKIGLFSLLLAIAAPPAMAAPRDYAAAVAYKGRPAEAVALDAGRKPAEILDFMQLKPGMRVLDIMTGTGYYAEIMARVVGAKGSITAYEPAGFMEGDKEKAVLAALVKREPNVRLTTNLATALASGKYDFAMLHLNYHDFYWQSAKYKWPRTDPIAMLDKLYNAMKPGGIVSVIDHVGTPGDTRDPAVVQSGFEMAGFVLEKESDLLRMPTDDLSKSVFDPAVRGKTDRMVLRYRKPA